MKKFALLALEATLLTYAHGQSWIGINQLGYSPANLKVAVLCAKQEIRDSTFQLVNVKTKRVVFSGKIFSFFGSYGPFTQTCRLDFSEYRQKGKYFLRTAEAESPVFPINDNVYDGTADFCLRYM